MNAVKQTGIKIKDKTDSVVDDGDIIAFVNTSDEIPTNKHEGKLGWWMCDLRHPNKLHSLKADIDAIFLCNTQYIDLYKKKYNVPVYYMPQCGLHPTGRKGRKIDFDVVFIGSILTNEYHSNRWEILEKFRKQFKTEIIMGEGNTEDQEWIYKQTPISLAISPPIMGYTSNRLYNILASGGFCLTLWFPGIEDLFKNKKHLVWFKTVEEGLELAKYYLKNKEERELIAEQGHQEYLKKHTAQKRLDKMFKILK